MTLRVPQASPQGDIRPRTVMLESHLPARDHQSHMDRDSHPDDRPGHVGGRLGVCVDTLPPAGSWGQARLRPEKPSPEGRKPRCSWTDLTGARGGSGGWWGTHRGLRADCPQWKTREQAMGWRGVRMLQPGPPADETHVCVRARVPEAGGDERVLKLVSARPESRARPVLGCRGRGTMLKERRMRQKMNHSDAC